MPDVLIFEDDPTVGDLAADVLRQKGLTVGHYLSGAGVLELVREGRPRLVVLDIMMPGMDGLSACRAIRSDPATRHVKIVILTAKDSRADQETARRYGADLFLRKPFESKAFDRSIGQLLGFPQAPDEGLLSRPPAPPVSAVVLPGAAALQTADLWVLFDAGPGLADWVHRQSRPPREAWLLLSRYEEEVLTDAGAGGVLLAAGCRVKLGGPDDPDHRLQRVAPRLGRGLPGVRATPLLYPQREGEFSLGDGAVAASCYTQHPGTTLAYRVEAGGRKMVYCPAHEVRFDQESWRGHEAWKFRKFFSQADLLIHGYRRSLADPRPTDERGAAAWEPVVDLAAEAGVRRLALVPLPAAAPIPGLESLANDRVARRGAQLAVSVVTAPHRFIL